MSETKPSAEEAWKVIDAKRPPDAKALVVAQYVKDESDPMTDYFGESVQREVAIGWRFTARENFKRLRQVAATFPETAHLGPDCDDYRVVCLYTEDRTENGMAHWKGHYFPGAKLHGDRFARESEARAAIESHKDEAMLPYTAYDIEHNSIEHRENYSMGKGNYLESRSNPWRVKSYALCDWVRSYAFEDQLPELSAQPETAAQPGPVQVDGVSLSENEERDGVEIRFPDKPPAHIRDELKAHGFRWSRFSQCWYKRRTPEALAFARGLAGENSEGQRDEGLAAMTDLDRQYEDACAAQVQ